MSTGSKKMFDFTSFQRTATALVGALVLSTACITAAVGPGHAVQPHTAAVTQSSAQAHA